MENHMITQHDKTETKHMREYKQNPKNNENHTKTIKQHRQPKMIKIGTRNAEQLFPLNGISTEDKDWRGILQWMNDNI